MAERTTYAWDTSVFIGWLRAEATAPLGNIELIVKEIDEGKAVLLVAVTAYIEVLEAKYTPEQFQAFRNFLMRSNVWVADTTLLIAERAGKLRSDALRAGRKIKTPDSTFLATAMVHKADVLHSLDTDMLQLNGNALVSNLKICKPGPLSGAQSYLNPDESI